MTLIFMFHSQEIFRIYQSSRVKLVNFHLARFVFFFLNDSVTTQSLS